MHTEKLVWDVSEALICIFGDVTVSKYLSNESAIIAIFKNKHTNSKKKVQSACTRRQLNFELNSMCKKVLVVY